MGKLRVGQRAHIRAQARKDVYDAGTLWRMTRDEWTARCALWSLPDRWELRVTVDADLLCSRRSARVHDLFILAEEWGAQMTRTGWKRVLPPARLPATVA